MNCLWFETSEAHPTLGRKWKCRRPGCNRYGWGGARNSPPVSECTSPHCDAGPVTLAAVPCRYRVETPVELTIVGGCCSGETQLVTETRCTHPDHPGPCSLHGYHDGERACLDCQSRPTG